MTPRELQGLLERCRAEESSAWEQLTDWVRSRGKAVFRVFGNLSKADRDDVIAATLKQLVLAIRHERISGNSNGAIHTYVRKAIRNKALDLLRTRARSAEVDEARLWVSA